MPASRPSFNTKTYSTERHRENRNGEGNGRKRIRIHTESHGIRVCSDARGLPQAEKPISLALRETAEVK